MIRAMNLTASLSLAAVLSAPAFAGGSEWEPVAQALGRPGSEMPGGVYRASLPRSDLKVTVDGVEVRPALALGSWLTFQKTGDQAAVLGDLVLTGEEVRPVMKRLAEGGIEITALHNHLLRSSPPVLYMHIHGRGDPVKLAAILHSALAESRTPFQAASPGAPRPPAGIGLDAGAVGETLGAKGVINGGVLQFSIPRAAPVADEGVALPPSAGVAIGINFQPAGGGKAAVTGDFVLVESEVNPVLKELLAHGIEVTALHTHMLKDQPRLFFMHFWAVEDAQSLARGLRAALDKIDIKRG
ncbi:MAG: DUF1259 domain-containing protein [Methylocapsa sp.]|nr:DUF1259 domain-containing protein [Methylocapsa sp.]